MQIKNKTFCILTLGCRTNICESDSISNQLLDDGAKISDDFKNANICIVNTCCVTTKAESKSKYYINQAIRSAKCELIVVIGCLSQMDAKLFQHPKIGIIIGNNGKNSILEYIHQYDGEHQILNIKKFQKSDSFEQYNNLNALERTRAFIKIQDGCDFMCSYCIIPFVRGRQRSLPHQNVLKLIKTLVDNNHKEIVLTGVNTAGYRENEKYGFLELLQSINKLKGNFRVRISSLEPFQINHKIIDLITKNKKRWCQQFHICIQSGSDKVIKSMNRKYTISQFISLCKYIRTKNKTASITTDYIVGFPNETRHDFDISCRNLKKIQFASIHIFPFSSRPFTPASKLPKLITDYEKKKRFLIIEKIKKESQEKYLKNFVGKVVNVLFEKSSNSEWQSGHSEYFFTVKVKSSSILHNKLLKVKVVNIKGNELFGKLV